MIVLIDDDLTFASVMSRTLIKKGAESVFFETPAEFLKNYVQDFEGVILLDLKIGDDSGLRWIETIRNKHPQCRLILLTGYASIATAVAAIKLGADDYLPKPITAGEILAKLKNEGESAVAKEPMSVDRLQWEHLQRVLADNQGNVSATARALGMHRRTLQRKLSKKPKPE